MSESNIHGLLRGFFNQPATESLISTTYKLRDVPFPMAEEGCKLEGLGQDILHLDRRCSVGPSTWVCYKTRRRTKRINSFDRSFRASSSSGLLTWFDDADGRNHWKFIQLRSPKGKCVGYRIPNRAPSALNSYCAYLVYQLLGQLLT